MKKADMCSTHLDFQIYKIRKRIEEKKTLKFRSVSRFTLITNK